MSARSKTVGQRRPSICNTADKSGAMRRNKAFWQLKREMESKMRQKQITESREKEEEEWVIKVATAAKAKKKNKVKVEVAYVDRDRGAAVLLGNKDIKNVLKVIDRHDNHCGMTEVSEIEIAQTNCQVKRRREKNDSSQVAAILDEVEFDTHLMQGEYELRYNYTYV